jgi:hypothetical protein
VDFATANQIYQLAISMDKPLGLIDNFVSDMTEEEKQVWIKRLGEVIRVINDQIIDPILRQYPSLDQDGED